MKKTNLFKTGVLFILSLMLIAGMVPYRPYAQTKVTANFFGNHADSDNNKENGYFSKTITIKNKYFNSNISSHPESPLGAGSRIQLFFVVLDGVIHPAYCIEPGAPVNGSWVYNGSSGTSSTDPYWEYIRNNHKKVAESISLTIGYANQYSKAADFSGARAACQLIIWEIIGGYRNATTRKVTDTALRNATAGSRFEKYYDLISNQLINHDTVPSFVKTDKNSAQTITLSYNEEKKEWGKNITTTTGSIDMIDYTPLMSQGISVQKINNNTIYMYTKNKISSAKTYTVYKNLPDSLYSDNMYIWTSYTGGERGQCIVSGTNNVRVPFYFKLSTEPVYRNIEINYYDKYTNEVIHTQYKSTGREMNSAYDETNRVYGTIEHNNKNYYYCFTSGDSIKGTLNTDKVINVYYGYDHKVTVNNFDKYTNEKIADSFVSSSAEHLSEYNVTEHVLPEIEYEGIFYSLYPELNSGDTTTGILDSDKTIDLFYGYTHNITVNYYDKYTNQKISQSYISEQTEHNTDYDVTDKTTILFDDYDFIDRIEGDTTAGTLDCNKVIDVYYGYNHNTAINYFDKYTNEIIYTQLVTEPAEHLSEYDVTEHILPQIEYEGTLYSHYPELNAGDSATGILDKDKTIDLYYGYTHDITVNYYDKYTNQKISQSYISEQTEYNSDYDVTEKTTLTFDGYDFIDRIEGDAISGTLDCNKVIDIYYGYNHNITIEYRDEDTDKIISDTITYFPAGEHNTDYDKTTDTVLNIVGYTKTKISGAPKQGTLDCDKTIIVWYKKDPEEIVPETSDNITSASLSGLIAGAACICTLFHKSKKEL